MGLSSNIPALWIFCGPCESPKALEARDADTACALMLEHLGHVENTLRLEMPADAEVDFAALFA